jgi:hypothetical protein
MSTFRTTNENGQLIMYGFNKPVGYYVNVWKDLDDEKPPIIAENHFTGLTGAKLVEKLEDELGVFIPEYRRKQAMKNLPFEDEELSSEDKELPF